MERIDFTRWYARYVSSRAGKQVDRERKQRLAALEQVKTGLFQDQVFRRPDNMTILSYLNEGMKYSSSYWELTALGGRPRSGAGEDGCDDDSDSDDESDGEDEEATHRAKQHRTMTAAALLETNETNKVKWVTDRTVLYLRAMRNICGVSAKKMLLVQYLSTCLMAGRAPSTDEEAKTQKLMTVTGQALETRYQRLDWRDQQITASTLAAAPGFVYFSADGSIIDHSEMETRHVYQWSEDEKRPVKVVLPIPPIGAKDSLTSGLALFDSLNVACPEMGAEKVGGGVSDNAAAAVAAIERFVDGVDKDKEGEDEEGVPVRPFVNGVRRRVLWVGSVLHYTHLIQKWWRTHSYGGKIDMHDPNHVQLVYKFQKVMNSGKKVRCNGYPSKPV